MGDQRIGKEKPETQYVFDAAVETCIVFPWQPEATVNLRLYRALLPHVIILHAWHSAEVTAELQEYTSQRNVTDPRDLLRFAIPAIRRKYLAAFSAAVEVTQGIPAH